MPADIFATTAWQTVGPLAAATAIQCKGAELQISDVDPGSDLEAGIVLGLRQALVAAAGATIWYRSAVAATASPAAPNQLKVRVALIEAD